MKQDLASSNVILTFRNKYIIARAFIWSLLPKILLKKVPDPQRFGVAELEGDKVINILEKPEVAPSEYAVTGVYMYDHRVFDIIDTLKRSDRGELEITDVNNRYIEWGDMTYDVLEGWWTDAGTIESLLLANNLVANSERKGAAGGRDGLAPSEQVNQP